MTGRLPLFALVALVTLAACAKQEAHAPSGSAPGRTLTPLVINVRAALTYGTLYIAKEEGFFAEEGIDARLVDMDLNSTMLAIPTGKLDVVNLPTRSGIFNLMVRGLPVQIVADRGHHSRDGCAAAALIAPAAMADRMLATRNYKGEKFALIRGGGIEYVMDRFLRKHGFTRNDVQLVQFPQGEGGSPLAQEVDAVRYVSEPILSRSLKDGRHRILATVQDIETGHQAGLVLFGRRLLQDEPDLGHRFMRAYLRGVRQYNEGKTPRNLEIMQKYTRLPQDVLKEMCWERISRDGVVREDGILPFLQWAREAGYLEGDVPVSRWWNPAYVEAANRALDGKAQ